MKYKYSYQYLGDIARSYFYLATAYYGEWGCCDEVGVNGSDIKQWMEGNNMHLHIYIHTQIYIYIYIYI